MSKGKSQAGTGQSDGYIPTPSGSTTFDQAMSLIKKEQKMKEATKDLEDKDVITTDAKGKRRFNP